MPGIALPSEVKEFLAELSGSPEEQLRRFHDKTAPKSRPSLGSRIGERELPGQMRTQFVLYYQTACLVTMMMALGVLRGKTQEEHFLDLIKLQKQVEIKADQIKKYFDVGRPISEKKVLASGAIELLWRIAKVQGRACRQMLLRYLGDVSNAVLKRATEAAREAERGDKSETEVMRRARAELVRKQPRYGKKAMAALRQDIRQRLRGVRDQLEGDAGARLQWIIDWLDGDEEERATDRSEDGGPVPPEDGGDGPGGGA